MSNRFLNGYQCFLSAKSAFSNLTEFISVPGLSQGVIRGQYLEVKYNNLLSMHDTRRPQLEQQIDRNSIFPR